MFFFFFFLKKEREMNIFYYKCMVRGIERWEYVFILSYF